MEEELILFEEGERTPSALDELPGSLAAMSGPESPTVDPETVRQAAAGDREAFTALFYQTYRYAFTLISPHLQREEDVRDALQETYTQVWAGLPRLREPTAFLGWLKTIARVCAVRLYNRQKRETLVADPAVGEGFLTDEPVGDTVLDIRAVLNTLPEEQARLLVLVYYDGMSLSDIAKM